jgi:NAD(P)-dependent dehydrogenase (short-subunit alcohol dehydrogenase family)
MRLMVRRRICVVLNHEAILRDARSLSRAQLRPEGRDQNWAARNPLGRVGESRELANLASFLVSDSAGYINGEMVVQDCGAQLRSSGAEDLLAWTDAQWEKQRTARSNDRA